MAYQFYNTTVISSGTIATLNIFDTLYIGKNGFLASTNGTSAVDGSGSYNDVTVLGEIASGIELGDDSFSDSTNTILIGPSGSVSGGIEINSYYSSVENYGVITATDGFSVQMTGNADFFQSRFYNDGLMVGGILRDGSEDFELINDGVIRGQQSFPLAYSSRGTGDQRIENNGVMSGQINFSDGNDVYDGRDGILRRGIVDGGKAADTLLGGVKDESFIGGLGADTLKGGGGADDFIYRGTNESTTAKAGRDLILDFSQDQHDVIDLSWIDTIPDTSGHHDDDFIFIGNDAFSGQVGELRFSRLGANTLVSGDLDGDKLLDFAIELEGRHNLAADDFVL